MALLTKEQTIKQTPLLIRTSMGDQCMVTYVGSVGRADCYKFKDAKNGQISYVATFGRGEFGPLCKDLYVAVRRAKNVFCNGR